MQFHYLCHSFSLVRSLYDVYTKNLQEHLNFLQIFLWKLVLKAKQSHQNVIRALMNGILYLLLVSVQLTLYTP